MRTVSVSSTRAAAMKASGKSRMDVVAYSPVNPYREEIHRQLAAEQGRTNRMQPKEREQAFKNQPFVKSVNWGTTKLKPFEIVCRECGERMGVVWAADKDLSEWQDFYYTQWHDENEWHGCLTPHVSPIDGTLCMECTCGVDTRDFRANRSLPPQVALRIEKDNARGRAWGRASSYFVVKPINITKLSEILNGRSYLH